MRYHFVKHNFSTWSLAAGVSAGKRADPNEVSEAVRLLQPRASVPMIRLGAQDDGGYLVPNDLEGIAACFSPGVAEEASFEEEMLERNIRCYCIDGSVSKSPLSDSRLKFERLFLDANDSEGRISLDSWVHGEEVDGDLIGQIDIEGSEWAALLAASPTTLSRFRMILLELHECEKIFDIFGIRIVKAVLEKLNALFEIVHVHPNNCSGVIKYEGIPMPRVLELTLLRKDRVALLPATEVQLPHPLDQPNDPRYPDIDLRGLTRFWN